MGKSRTDINYEFEKLLHLSKYECGRFYDFKLIRNLFNELGLHEDLSDIMLNLFWLRLDKIIKVDEIDFYYRCIEKGLRNDFGTYCKNWVSLQRIELGYEWRLL